MAHWCMSGAKANLPGWIPQRATSAQTAAKDYCWLRKKGVTKHDAAQYCMLCMEVHNQKQIWVPMLTPVHTAKMGIKSEPQSDGIRWACVKCYLLHHVDNHVFVCVREWVLITWGKYVTRMHYGKRVNHQMQCDARGNVLPRPLGSGHSCVSMIPT